MKSAILAIVIVLVTWFGVSVTSITKYGQASQWNTYKKMNEYATTLKAIDIEPSCLAEDKSLDTTHPELSRLDKYGYNQFVTPLTTAITDVPAGTQVNIKFASDNGKTVTGTQKYDNGYGAYNFTLNKEVLSDVMNPNGNVTDSTAWVITSLTPCHM